MHYCIKYILQLLVNDSFNGHFNQLEHYAKQNNIVCDANKL